MAIEAEMKRAVRRLVEVFGKFAAHEGWGPSDYRLYFLPNTEWGYIAVILVVSQLTTRSRREEKQKVLDFVKKELNGDTVLFRALSLTLKTFKQVEEMGEYAIPRQYLEAGEL